MEQGTLGRELSRYFEPHLGLQQCHLFQIRKLNCLQTFLICAASSCLTKPFAEL